MAGYVASDELEGLPGWYRHAACHGMDTELFFATPSAGSKAALAVCAGCPVRVECREHAIATDVEHGVWGGLAERELRALREPSPPPVRPCDQRCGREVRGRSDRCRVCTQRLKRQAAARGDVTAA